MSEIQKPESLPTMPAFNLGRIEQLRETLDLAFIDFVGTVIEGEQFAALVEKVHKALPKGVPLLTVHNSLLTLVGTQLTKGETARTSWRLAGNTSKLRSGIAIPPWTTQTEQEWVPLQVIEVLPGKDNYNNFGFFVHHRVLAGTSCPLRVIRFWRKRYAVWMAGNFGFTIRRRGHGEVFPYRDGIELTNMRLMGLMDPVYTRDGAPNYRQFACTGSVLEWNKQLLRARNHTDPPCPEGFKYPCRQCFVGYDQCFAGCHPTTWDWGECPECKQEAWCDPGHPRGICVGCQVAGR